MEQQIYSVTQVNTYIQSMMDSDRLLAGLCVRGELSNYKVYPSGHHYFSLKDATGALRCVMFKSSALRLRFRPENGMKVLAMGRISVFPRDGAYQLYCTGLTPDGVGDLHVAFEQLKAKLQAEGLFDPAHKKPLPRYPGVIAIVTSSAGAAVHDMLRILRKRYPLSKVLLLPVRVQGAEAPAELCGAIRYVNRWNLADLIITGRGGGSLEDLWAFNDETLARTIYESRIPVISAVGHEPDVTISDYVADLRAATPSNAAELAVPDQAELVRRLRSITSAMGAQLSRQVKLNRKRMEVLASSRPLQSPTAYVDERRLLLDGVQRRLCTAQQQTLAGSRQRCVRLTAALDAMSPLKVLTRGYAMAQTEDGRLLRTVEQTSPGGRFTLHLADGRIRASVEAIERTGPGGGEGGSHERKE
ncbi:MAG TPA: exodeoxyribonuclease VII large subunit [Candidatus Faecousia gallistercoris]|nr:exodeoxyribonuclease VII large subunit [Candidatus Faecousia gallistercoris]